MVLRLEPRDVNRSAIDAGDLSKADECAHLVDVVTDGLRHRFGARDVGVYSDLEQGSLAAQTPQQSIEKRETVVIAVQDHRTAEVDKGSGNAEGGSFVRRRVPDLRIAIVCEQAWLFFACRPFDLLGWNTLRKQAAGSGAPAVEVGGAGEGDRVHGLTSVQTAAFYDHAFAAEKFISCISCIACRISP